MARRAVVDRVESCERLERVRQPTVAARRARPRVVVDEPDFSHDRDLRRRGGRLAARCCRRIVEGVGAGEACGRIVGEATIGAERDRAALRGRRSGGARRHAGVVAGVGVRVVGEHALRGGNGDLNVADGVVIIAPRDDERRGNERRVRVDGVAELNVRGRSIAGVRDRHRVSDGVAGQEQRREGHAIRLGRTDDRPGRQSAGRGESDVLVDSDRGALALAGLLCALRGGGRGGALHLHRLREDRRERRDEREICEQQGEVRAKASERETGE